MLVGFSLERQDCLACFFETWSAVSWQETLTNTAAYPVSFLGTSWSVWFSPSASQAPPASLQTVFVLMCVIQDAGIRLKTVSCVCCNTSSRRRRESCSSQLLQEFSVVLFIWLSFFPFSPPVSYFSPSQNSLFPLPAVNCMHATASPPHAVHFPPSWLWPSGCGSGS